MNITLHRAADVADRHWSAWREIQQANDAFRSPYFHPEFTRAVAAVRGDVEVAVLEDHGEPVGFFPFQREGRGKGHPVGGRLSDFHGVILREGQTVELAELMRACRLGSWRFDHLVTARQPFQSMHWDAGPSPYLSLDKGYAAYRSARIASGTQLFQQTERKARKLDREVGPARFEWHTTRDEVFRTLLAWKSRQYQATGLIDVFAFPWTVALLERLRQTSGDDFSLVLSAMFVAERPIAVHLGMRSGRVLHSWFPAYDQELAKYSPGQCMFLKVAETCSEHGVTRIDFGKGDEMYKLSMMTAAEFVAEGVADHHPLSRAARRAWHEARRWVRAQPWLRAATEVPSQLLRPLRERRSFR